MSTSGSVCETAVPAESRVKKAAKRSLYIMKSKKLMAKDSQDAGSSAIAIV